MADRQASRQPQGVTRTRPAANSVSSANVRRNLFQNQLTRRPTHGGASGASSVSSESAFRMDPESSNGHSESSDIVVRDKNGEAEFDEPPTPPIDDPEEEALDSRQESERERQRLADVVRHHQINQNSVLAQPEEVLEAVRASLRAKVAALDDDNWMFEREEPPRHS